MVVQLFVFALMDEFGLPERLMVLILGPELRVGRLRLVTRTLEKYAKVSSIILRAEAVRNLLQELSLLHRKALIVRKLGHQRHRAVLLNSRCHQMLISLTILRRLAQVLELILLEARHEGALMFLEDQLRDEEANSLILQHLAYIDLFIKPLARHLMSTHTIDAVLVPVAVAEEAATEGLQNARVEILSVAVEVFTAASNPLHHAPLGFHLRLGLIEGLQRRSWVDRTDERAVEFEGLVVAEYECENRPNDAREATDKTEDKVE